MPTTAVVFDHELQSQHAIPWPVPHVETPQRTEVILQRLQECGLVERCMTLQPRLATLEEISRVHTKEYVEQLASTENASAEECERVAACFEDVYIAPHTYRAALQSAGCCLDAARAVLKEQARNAFAIVRPPGHHAWADQANGFCLFNNVAICVRDVLESDLATRVLIVDPDVHHGQGTQRIFYDDPRVMYWSSHRYQRGEFWPSLREGDADYVGEKGKAEGYNINVPLDELGLNDADFLAIILRTLLPAAIEFQPDAVFVCMGFDAALGDPQGEMKASPLFYEHLIRLLSSCVSSRIVCCLEGGYFLPSLAQCAEWTLKALLEPAVNIPVRPANLQPLTLSTIARVEHYHAAYWKACAVAKALHPCTEEELRLPFRGLTEPPQPPHDTRCLDNAPNSPEVQQDFERQLGEVQRSIPRDQENRLTEESLRTDSRLKIVIDSQRDYVESALDPVIHISVTVDVECRQAVRVVKRGVLVHCNARNLLPILLHVILPIALQSDRSVCFMKLSIPIVHDFAISMFGRSRYGFALTKAHFEDCSSVVAFDDVNVDFVKLVDDCVRRFCEEHLLKESTSNSCSIQ